MFGLGKERAFFTKIYRKTEILTLLIVIMNSRFSKSASLLLAALMTPAVVATAEDDRKPAAKRPAWEDWVGHTEAMYRKAGGKFGDQVANTKDTELSVKALPKERLTILKSQEEWENFVE